MVKLSIDGRYLIFHKESTSSSRKVHIVISEGYLKIPWKCSYICLKNLVAAVATGRLTIISNWIPKGRKKACKGCYSFIGKEQERHCTVLVQVTIKNLKLEWTFSLTHHKHKDSTHWWDKCEKPNKPIIHTSKQSRMKFSQMLIWGQHPLRPEVNFYLEPWKPRGEVTHEKGLSPPYSGLELKGDTTGLADKASKTQVFPLRSRPQRQDQRARWEEEKIYKYISKTRQTESRMRWGRVGSRS